MGLMPRLETSRQPNYTLRYPTLSHHHLEKKPIELSKKFPRNLKKELLIRREYYDLYKKMYIKEFPNHLLIEQRVA